MGYARRIALGHRLLAFTTSYIFWLAAHLWFADIACPTQVVGRVFRRNRLRGELFVNRVLQNLRRGSTLLKAVFVAQDKNLNCLEIHRVFAVIVIRVP